MDQTLICITISVIFVIILCTLLNCTYFNVDTPQQNNPTTDSEVSTRVYKVYTKQNVDPIGRPLALPYEIFRHPQLLYPPNPTFGIFGRCL